MAAPCRLLGDGVTDDTLLHIAVFLSSARDFLHLQLTCPRFAAKVVAASRFSGGGGGPTDRWADFLRSWASCRK